MLAPPLGNATSSSRTLEIAVGALTFTLEEGFPSFSTPLGLFEGRSSESAVFFDRIKESFVGMVFRFFSIDAIIKLWKKISTLKQSTDAPERSNKKLQNFFFGAYQISIAKSKNCRDQCELRTESGPVVFPVN